MLASSLIFSLKAVWHLCSLFLILLVFSVSTEYCDQLYDHYYGYPECRNRMSELGWTCDRQRQWSTPLSGEICPDPDWVNPSNVQSINNDGSTTMLVYRAMRAFDDEGNLDFWAQRLHNANAADAAGVLGYLSAEVVPEDMRTSSDRNAHQRKWSYDGIMVFNVTFKAPSGTSSMGRYSAMDRGQCTAGDEPGQACNFFEQEGYTPGRQTYNDPRNNFVGKWYSFPKCGLCDWPTGQWDCTYTYNIVGLINLDDLVFPHSTPGVNGVSWSSTNWPDYSTFTRDGGIEFDRTSSQRPSGTNGNCNTPGGVYYNMCNADFHGLDFWSHICDTRSCLYKQQLLDKAHIDATYAGPMIPVDEWNNDCASNFNGMPGGPIAAPTSPTSSPTTASPTTPPPTPPPTPPLPTPPPTTPPPTLPPTSPPPTPQQVIVQCNPNTDPVQFCPNNVLCDLHALECVSDPATNNVLFCQCPTTPPPTDPTTAPANPPTPSTGDPDQYLCELSGLSNYRPDDIRVCDSTPTECRVYEKLNHVIGGDTPLTCTEYCGHFGLNCVNGWKDRSNFNCDEGDQIGCENTDGNTSDHICQCGVAPVFLTSKLRTLPNRQEPHGGSLLPV